MTNNAKKIADEIYDHADGLKRIEAVELPPKIKWGDEFLSWTPEKKLQYLMKFAEAMNHAADVIQRERNLLGELVEKKEEQLQQMQSMLDANNQMLQQEITRMNEERNKTNKYVAQLNARIRELEHGA